MQPDRKIIRKIIQKGEKVGTYYGSDVAFTDQEQRHVQRAINFAQDTFDELAPRVPHWAGFAHMMEEAKRIETNPDLLSRIHAQEGIDKIDVRDENAQMHYYVPLTVRNMYFWQEQIQGLRAFLPTITEGTPTITLAQYLVNLGKFLKSQGKL